MFLIKDGYLVDGTGGIPVRNRGMLISEDKISFNFNSLTGKDVTEINAKGMIIAPGFIDTHSHSDVNIVKNPSAQNRILQGITTEVIGNCGFSPFPVTNKNEQFVRNNLEEEGVELNWRNVKEYAEILDKKGPAINLVPLIGQGTLRSAVMRFDARKPTNSEIKKMKQILEDNLSQGAFGMSSGLEYTPSGFADVDELAELCKVVKRKGGVYTTHMRDEGDLLEESINESLLVSRKSKVKLEISHLKSVKRANWGKGIKELLRLERLARSGEPVTWDAYPYDASSTSLTITLPKKIMDGGFESMLESIKDLKIRNQAKKVMAKKRSSEDWEGIIVEDMANPEISKYNHRSIYDISKDMKESCEETVFRLLEKNRKDITIIAHTMNEIDVDTIVSHPLTAIGSDSSVYVKGTVHPRSFGTFPRVFRKYVREMNFCSVQEMVRKTSSLAADTFRIKGRGYLKEGYYADIVIFNLAFIEDKSTFENPTIFPQGIEYLFVNGILEIDKGKITGNRGGRVLRPS